VSHAPRLIAALEDAPGCNTIPLDKRFGETVVAGRHEMDEPRWEWPAR
jgi:predicted ATPase